MPVSTPPVFLKAFAEDAGGSYIENPIPLTTVDPERASLTLGFPPQTMQTEVSGGTPPFGQDMNGALYMVSANIKALQAGQPYLYNATLAAAISGYKAGTILGMADGSGLWQNMVDGNTTDPDASGADWVGLYRYGYQSIPSLTGGTRTITLMEARAPVLVLTGTLTSNLSVDLPTLLQEWKIVNATTGSFVTTVKTAAGTGVVVAQGGYAAPVDVYGNGTNIYYSDAPTVIPGDTAATPDTYAVRDNTGALYATAFNNSAALTNPTIGAVVVQNLAADGFMQKISLANFITQIFGARNLAGNGYYTLPGGFRINWGTFTAAGNAITNVSYAGAYATFSRPVCSGGQINDPGAQDNAPAVVSAGLSGFSVYNSRDGSIPTWWIAVGV